MIVVDPNPKLIEYLEKADNSKEGFAFYSDGNLPEFIDNDEWHYLISDMELNIFLLKRLENLGLLKKKNHICDAGIGLGTALYDLYLQSEDLTDKEFTFTGIEKSQKYIDFLRNNLIHFWNDNLNIIKSDLMDCDYSNYDIVYSYCPFKGELKLMEFYTKLVDELSVGSIIIEHRNYGLGQNRVLERFYELEKIDLDGMWVFQKK